MITLGPIGQISLPVDDIDKATRFYRDDLGIPFLFDVPPQRMAFFNCDGVRLFISEPEEGQQFQPANTINYFRVESVRRAHTEMKGRGIEFVHEPHVIHRSGNSELWMAFLRDPAGNLLAIMSDEPASTPA